MRHALLTIVVAVAFIASGCAIFQENREKICGTAAAVCSAGQALCDLYGCNESTIATLDDICASANALCAILPTGTAREIAIAKAVYEIDLDRFEEATAQAATAKPVARNDAHGNWERAKAAFAAEYLQ